MFFLPVFLSLFAAAEAAESPGSTRHPAGGPDLGPERFGGSPHGGAGEKPAG